MQVVMYNFGHLGHYNQDVCVCWLMHLILSDKILGKI